MNARFLKDLGYNTAIQLTEIQRKHNVVTSVEGFFSQQTMSSPLEEIEMTLKRAKNLIFSKDIYEEEPFYRIGYNYADTDPSIGTVFENFFLPEMKEVGFINIRKYIHEYQKGNLEKKTLLNELNTIFTKVAQGKGIYACLPSFEKMNSILESHKILFATLKNAPFYAVEREINIIEIIYSLGHSPNTTILTLEQKDKVIQKLKFEFEKLKTPDKRETVKDRISQIEKRLSKHNESNDKEDLNLYLQGYLIATRGENPDLFNILKRNSSFVFLSSWNLHFANEGGLFSANHVENTRTVLEMILKGYAYASHLKFLQEFITENESKKIVENSEINELEGIQIKLKWLGQKNQYYDWIRHLKNEGLIGNSYEELGLFTKLFVDCFQNNALATIQKELGKNKMPTKNKRIKGPEKK
ncbi:hypothetical protein A4H97_33805 [Niastella yeongjuensis]|uniref:Uncharacterized protein n=1 Tax=Niastella yeongjuensis TaxID=354355 RepID=A0A1V9EBZ1_9BACT|nr:hypothetical protein [Niastella yeongjuensis]OQP43626.1 hypothetical protein A4H97_33805 [Niastella yeongjuensis]SEP49309.1 hypothetical protein SAMN05660816_06945 [Niastella yeongjuensis]